MQGFMTANGLVPRVLGPFAIAVATAFVLWTMSPRFFTIYALVAGLVLGLVLPRSLAPTFFGFWLGLASAALLSPPIEASAVWVQSAVTLFTTALTSLKVLAAAFVGRMVRELSRSARQGCMEESRRLIDSYDRPMLVFFSAVGLWLVGVLYSISLRPDLMSVWAKPYMLGVYLTLPLAVSGILWRRVAGIAVALNGAYWFPAAVLSVVKGQILTGVFAAIALGFAAYRIFNNAGRRRNT